MKTPTPLPLSLREAAFLAYVFALEEKGFIEESLDMWHDKDHPSYQDRHLARQIAAGTCRHQLTLDYILKAHLNSTLPKKIKEKALVRQGLYQLLFLDRIPDYAVVNETVKLGTKYISPRFAKFLNAILRKASTTTFTLPQENTTEALSLRFSYPSFFVDRLVKELGLEKTKDVLQIGNEIYSPHCRLRNHAPIPENCEWVTPEPFPICRILKTETLFSLIKSPSYTIQNATPATLMGELKKTLSQEPRTILDLAAAPGGKLVALSDLFPQATLYANDISDSKIEELRKTLEHFQIKAHLSAEDGRFLSLDPLFDLVVLDAPCSNTGVLHKRPEARWRINQEHLNEECQLQRQLLKHAADLLKPGGHLWYLTCSILDEENEDQLRWAEKELALEIVWKKRFLPDVFGWDGGFGACFRKKN